MSASRTERLLALVLVLLSAKRPLTRSEIRSAVLDYPSGGSDSAFERMFERDKDELRSMGIPIESVEVDEAEGTGYRLATGKAFLPEIQIDPEERIVLAMASRLWQEATWGHDSLNALRKLELAGDFTAESTGEFAVSVNVDSGALTKILDATAAQRRIEFTYRKAGETPARRSLEPWGVVAARGQWYLVGHDLGRDATRAFRMSRITGDIKVSRAAKAFSIPDGVDLRQLVTDSFPSPEAISATVELAPGQGARLRQLASTVDGSTARFADIDPARLMQEVLSAGPAARLIEPDHLRAEVISSLESVTSQVPPQISDADLRALKAARERARKTPAEPAGAQVSRLLALVPWLRRNRGISYAQAAKHFDVSVARLRQDLELAVCTEFGSNLLTLDIDLWGETITVRDAQGMGAPLQLTRSEAISLVIGLRLLTQVPGPHPRAAIENVSAKIEAAVGDAASVTRYLDVAPAADANTEQGAIAEKAVEESRALDLRYWSASRDEVSERTVDPIAILRTQGASYLEAWCRSAEAVRMFRIDRIEQATVRDEPANVPDHVEGPSLTVSPRGAPGVALVEPSIAWWADQVPTTARVVRDDGSALVALDIASEEWAIRTALGFGGRLVFAEPHELGDAIRDRASKALAHYVA